MLTIDKIILILIIRFSFRDQGQVYDTLLMPNSRKNVAEFRRR